MSILLREMKSVFVNFIESIFYSRFNKKIENDEIFEKINSQRIHDNLITICPAALLLIIIELFGQLSGFVFGFEVQKEVAAAYRAVIWAFAVVSAVFFVLVEVQLRNLHISNKIRICTICVFWICYSLNAMIFSCLEMYDQGTTNNFMVFLAVFTFLPTLGFIPATIFYWSSLLVEIFAIYNLGNLSDPKGVMVTCLGATALGYVVSGFLYASSISDNISKKKFEYLSEIDPMTLMLNRRGAKRQSDILWDNCKRHDILLCAVMIDIDFFKNYNDTFGHSMGDECIKAVSGRIKDSFKRKSDIVARYGGEEFLVIFSGIEANDVLEHIMDMLDNIRNLKMEAGNKSASDVVTVSAGLFSNYPKYFDSIEQFIENADRQLYNVKKHGRNGLSYENEIFRTKAAIKSKTSAG